MSRDHERPGFPPLSPEPGGEGIRTPFGWVILLNIVLFFSGLGGLYLYHSSSMPSAAELGRYLTDNQPLFEKATRELITIFSQEGYLEQGVRHRYNDLLGIKQFEVINRFPPEIRYYTHTRGSGSGACGKGLAYMESPPAKLYPNFAEMEKELLQGTDFIGFVHVTGNWYGFSWQTE